MGSSSWSVVICVISARFFTNPQAYTSTNKRNPELIDIDGSYNDNMKKAEFNTWQLIRYISYKGEGRAAIIPASSL